MCRPRSSTESRALLLQVQPEELGELSVLVVHVHTLLEVQSEVMDLKSLFDIQLGQLGEVLPVRSDTKSLNIAGSMSCTF